jgi:hypothetical protein
MPSKNTTSKENVRCQRCLQVGNMQQHWMQQTLLVQEFKLKLVSHG